MLKQPQSLILISFIIIAVLCTACTNSLSIESTIKITAPSAKPSIPPPPVEYTVKVTAAGDLLIHNTIYNSARKPDGSYDFNPIFSEVKFLFQEADLSIVNLEVPVAGNIFPPSNFPNFNSPPALLDAVKNMGVDVVSTANNHALDKGFAGLQETIKNAADRGITVVGTYMSEDTKPLIVEKNNIRLGVASYTYGTNGIPLPSSAPYCVNVIDEEKMLADIMYMKEKSADFIIFNMHFGNEYQTKQNAAQEDVVNFLFENGADVIFGSHPHVPQPMEERIITLSDGFEKKVFVVYSMGNLVAHQDGYYTKLGGVASVTLSKKGTVTNLLESKITPVYTHRDTNGFKIMPLEKTMLEYKQGSSEYARYKKMLEDANDIFNH